MPKPQLQLLDAKAGFELRLVGDAYTDHGSGGYTLELTPLDDGRVSAAILVDTSGLSQTAVELKFPSQSYAVSEGEYGDWPGEKHESISHKLDLDQPGVLRYVARLKQEQAGGVSGKFELLRVVFDPARRP
jgi:hypothetical protein